MKKLINYLIIMFCMLPAVAEEYTPAMMPDVNRENRYQYISDPEGLMSPAVKESVNSRLWELRRRTTAEVVVAIPPSIGDTPLEEWSEKLFTLWGIGKKDKDNGVLIVIAPGQRKARIQTGYGTEGVLPDIACRNIIETAIVPNMKAGDLDAAVNASTALVSDALSDPDVAEELRSREHDNFSGNISTLSAKDVWKYIRIIAGCVFLFCAVVFFRDLIQGKKRDNYHKAVMWHDHLTAYLLCSVFSLGMSLIFLLSAFLLYRHYRTKPRKCPACGTRMRRLGEKEDNECLSASQDFEEKIDTVDYDVWECPRCGSIERYAFPKKQNTYTECPDCHTIAYRMVGTHTLVPATTSRPGKGEKIYECRFCHNQKRVPFVIPKKDDSAALLAGAAIGAISGHRGGGGFGGGSGGGFGGGSTGGGGASGGW